MSGAMPFVAGFGLGLLVLPLTFVVGATVGGGGGGAAFPVFVALTGGAMALPPVSGERALGVAAGIGATIVAGTALVAMLLSGVTLG